MKITDLHPYSELNLRQLPCPIAVMPRPHEDGSCSSWIG